MLIEIKAIFFQNVKKLFYKMFSPPEQHRPSDADKKQLLKYIQLSNSQSSDSLDATVEQKG